VDNDSAEVKEKQTTQETYKHAVNVQAFARERTRLRNGRNGGEATPKRRIEANKAMFILALRWMRTGLNLCR